MKANELRIGNYVETSEENSYPHGKITSINEESIIVENWDIFNKDEFKYIRPIILNEDMLLKCGFDYMYKNEWLSNGMFGIRKDFKYFVYGFPTLHTDKELFTCNIKYLHQLQNLYFALTGEELIVNL